MSSRSRPNGIDAHRLRESIPYLVHKVYSRMQRLRSRSFNLPMGDRAVIFEMMLLLGTNPGITQADVARELAMDKSNVASLMRALESAGWVSRQRQVDDARCFGVFLTPVGVRQISQLQAEWQRREQELVAPLSATERDSLVSSLQRLLDWRPTPQR
jgi:DNA-binding MarR family transcriptional regulator